MGILKFIVTKFKETNEDIGLAQLEYLEEQTQTYYKATQNLLNNESKVYLQEIANISRKLS